MMCMRRGVDCRLRFALKTGESQCWHSWDLSSSTLKGFWQALSASLTILASCRIQFESFSICIFYSVGENSEDQLKSRKFSRKQALYDSLETRFLFVLALSLNCWQEFLVPARKDIFAAWIFARAQRLATVRKESWVS